TESFSRPAAQVAHATPLVPAEVSPADVHPRSPVLLDPMLEHAGVQVCTRCIYDERVSAISFDRDGVCNYCHQTDALEAEYGTGTADGEAKLAAIVKTIRAEGRGKTYDCVVGVSGGTDSSYVVYLARKWGL